MLKTENQSTDGSLAQTGKIPRALMPESMFPRGSDTDSTR